MASELKAQISEAVKDAMKAREKERLGVLRLVMAEFKRIEVDERVELDDARVLVVLDKMVKQRRDSFKQFSENNRPELAAQEEFEIGVIQTFLPKALTDVELQAIVIAAVKESGAATVADMGKVMALVKPQVQGRADMGQVSQQVKAALAK